MKHPAAQQGFTLVELVIVVAIIAILAAVAVPSYRDYVMRTNRTVAKTALAELVSRQESYATDHKRYAASFERLGYAGSEPLGYVTGEGRITRSAAGALYRLELFGSASAVATCGGTSGVPAQRFVATATPVATQTDSKCLTLCLSSTGERGTTSGKVECWRR